MYARYFGLGQLPFSIAPDPRFLFMSERHREALAHLLYGVRGGGGFVLLTGEVGAGKTTVCRCFLEQVPKRCNVAYIFNPKLTVPELLKTVCEEFRIPYAHQGPGVPTVKDYIDPLNEFLLRTHAVGQNNVLVIDEAQNLSAEVLEQLRLLTNLETNERKLLQIILIGQPELRAMLARPELEQLAQRVIARYHLEPLSPSETVQYISHRLGVAGMTKSIPFDRPALDRIQALSRGVPRRINLLCDRALLGAYATRKTVVDRAIVEKAAQEVFGSPAPAARAPARYRYGAAAALGLLAIAAIAGLFTLTTQSGAWPDTQAGAPAENNAEATAGAAPAGDEGPAKTAATRPAETAPAMDLAANFAALFRSERDAWRALAPAWNVALGDGDPCQIASREQVYCFRSNNSNLPLIRQLGRPGILTLRDGDNRIAFALLTGLTNDSATLQVSDGTHTVSLVALAELWRGDFATFWRAPPGYGQKAAGSEPGPLADWLTKQLATLDRQQPADAPLRSKIHAFQLAQGLSPDGLAGPVTLMQLNRALGIDEPRLAGAR
jgi:general secretion pathway protein A